MTFLTDLLRNKKKLVARLAKLLHVSTGHVYGANLWKEDAELSLNHSLQIYRQFRRRRDLSNMATWSKELHGIMGKQYDDHRVISQNNYRFFDTKTIEANTIGRGENHNTQTASGLELENLILTGYSQRYLNVVGIGTGIVEPTSGSTELSVPITRLPVIPYGWLTPAGDLIFTGIIAGSNTPTGLYREFAGYTGLAFEDIMGWISLLAGGDYINHIQGTTVMVVSHIKESVETSD